jgi:chorismate mutase/prephenate dehydrogenase
MKELQKIRTQIRAVDASILRLLKRRLTLAQSIGKAKVAAGLPVRDFRIENDVLSAARAYCEKEGLAPELGEELMRTLIKGAVEVQEKIRGERFEGRLKTVLVIGGLGGMGRWFSNFFKAQGHKVHIADIRRDASAKFPFVEDVAAFAPQAEIIVIATPIRAVGGIIRELERPRTRALVFDVASIKSPFIKTLRAARRRGLRVGSIHPMFGPDAKLLSGRTLIICELGSAQEQRETHDLFAGTALSIVKMPLEDHDQWMAYIAYFDALAASGKSFAALNNFGSTTFHRQSTSSQQVANEHAELYFDIQHLNPHSAQVFDKLQASVARLKKAATQANSKSFLAIMARGRKYFDREA